MLVNLFSWNFSTISLMMAAGAVSLIMFVIKDIGISGGKSI